MRPFAAFLGIIGLSVVLSALAQESPQPVLDAAPPQAEAGPPTSDQDGPAGASGSPKEEQSALATIAISERQDQEQAGGTQQIPARNRFIEEIVVTAQKREENLQDVPISVAAFSGEALEARGVDDPTALAAVTPGLTYNELVGYSLIYIRGVGSDAFEPTADQSIATYIDGIYLPFGHGLAQNFLKLERIEVLKGPQGTLFGRNATGGAINIVSKKPSDIFDLSIDAGAGSYSSREAKIFVTGPLFSSLSASLSLLYSNVDSYYKLNTESSVRSLEPDETKGVNLRLLWQPFEQLSVSLNGLITRFEGTGSIANTVENPKPLGALLGIHGVDPGTASLDYQPFLAADNDLYYGQVAWTPAWLDIKLLGSHQQVNTDLKYDFDSSEKPVVYFHASNQFSDVTTAELQFLSKPDGILPNWLQMTAGLYYYQADTGYDPVIFGLLSANNPLILPSGLLDPILALLPPSLPIPSSGVALNLESTLQTEATAAYLQTTIAMADWLDLTLGGRYQREKRGTTAADVRLETSSSPLPLISFGLDSTTRSDFSPKATLGFKPNSDQLIYVTASKASKSGTYNLPAIYTPPRYVRPEVVTAFELGNKGAFFSGSLRYSIAAYLNKIKDLQTQIVSLQSGGAQNLVNADRARIRGLDLDLTWQLFPESLPGLVLTVAGSYIDGEYTSFPDGSGFNETTGIFFGQGSLTLSPPQDFAGNRAVRTPKYSYTIGPNYSQDIGNGTLELGMDYAYNSGYFFDTQNTVRQPRYSVINARIGYLYQPAGLRVTVFGKNLTDEVYYVNRFQTDFATNSLFAAPRTFGVRLSYDFRP